MITIFENVLSEEDLADLRSKLADSRFVDGKLTAGYRAKRVKNNEQVSWNQETAREVQDRILDALGSHKKLNRTCHPKRISRPLISRTSEGMGYGFHVDDARVGEKGNKNRSDISLSLFLNAPEDYEGGELEIITPYGMTAFKLPPGQAVAYPSRFFHQVKTVESGERLVAACWIESAIRQEQDREILLELDQVNQKLHQLAPDAPETDLSFKIYSNLLRRWAE